MQRTSYTRAIKYIKRAYFNYGEGKEDGKESEIVSETSEASSTSSYRNFLSGNKNTRPSSGHRNIREFVSSTFTGIKNVVGSPTDETVNSRDPVTPTEMESEDQSSIDSDDDIPKSPNASKIEIFNKRIRDLQERFEEGFFSTFHDPFELMNDPVIQNYLRKKY
ncbi:2006_t:CDS:1 [Acaulospora colombiana]|uniref:2006_t:CDS:1 n=1 Tax=Acaulospora colombiana TaxID=27376 RepID=A0ACA9LU50_9GLOM|nr:2006_t:CDS:1 [Acaulospora colombiana]